MAFDITSVLWTVSGPDTGADQIVYIDLDLLDPDPNNFDTIDGLDELAGNIELIGLQQPLRVRPGEDGHYVIVSGHRRRAACMMIRDGGSDQFARGVPCIVEYGEASEAMRELRLIYANASTRIMSPAEVSKQAERVETLLYQLKEEGVEFPGRMRDHVAEACKISKTKLPTHIDIIGNQVGLAKDSVILLEQIRTIDKKRLKEKMGHLDDGTMLSVNNAIQVSFGLTDG